MKSLLCFVVSALVLFPLLVFAGTDETKLTAENVLARHLQAVGTPEALRAAKSRTAEGSALMKVVVGGTGTLSGQAAMFSAGKKYKLVVRFPATEYQGEQILFDGNKATIALTAPNSRSLLGDFLYREPTILREGLFGGVMFTSWPAFDLASRQGRLQYDSVKKIDGKDLHQVTYLPKKSSDATIRLFFDVVTFRHVMSTYSLESEPFMSRSQTTRGDKVRYTLEERFENFQTVDGLTLPTTWDVRMTVSPVAAASIQWNVRFVIVTNNPPVDANSVLK